VICKDRQTENREGALAEPRMTAAEIAAWSNPDQQTSLSLNDATFTFQMLGPRNRFIQTTGLGGALLDAGAGNGSSLTLRKWLAPQRNDLRMYAWAGEQGEGFSAFEGFEVGYWPQHVPHFGGRAFDAILCANFIEHIDDPLEFIAWAVSRLAPGGRLYLEWPRLESMNLPTNAALREVGVHVTTGRYHDDDTHRQNPPLAEDVHGKLASLGMAVRESGVVSIPFIDQQLAIHARREKELASMTMAYWSHTGWCQYLVAEKTP
jgi:SAM-dependent methyltransferase